jgi:hypothetical protein
MSCVVHFPSPFLFKMDGQRIQTLRVSKTALEI